jgi:hypothetical protein
MIMHRSGLEGETASGKKNPTLGRGLHLPFLVKSFDLPGERPECGRFEIAMIFPSPNAQGLDLSPL